MNEVEVRITKDLAMVGAGYWGKNLARNFHALGSLHTICDRDPLALRKFSEEYPDVAGSNDLTSVLANDEIRKIVIAAPAVLHGEIVRASLNAGKDVFVEKPLCLDVDEAKSLVELAKASDCILMVGHLLQYHPCIDRLKEMVENGELGQLFYITSNRLNLGKIRHEENALWSFAPHDISVIVSLAGGKLPEQVQCSGKAYLNEGVADTTLTSLRFSGSLRAHIYVSWLNPFKEQKLTIVGSKGMAVFDDRKAWAEKLVVYRDHLTWTDGRTPVPSKAEAESVEMIESEPLRLECEHFLECCDKGHSPRTDGEEGVKVLKVLSMAQQSLDTDGAAVSRLDCSDTSESESSQEVRIGDSDPVAPEPDVPKLDNGYFSHESASVDKGAAIGDGTKIWHYSHIMSGATIGRNCSLGQNVNVDGCAVVGNNVKIQNNVSVYSGVLVEDDVFLGPSCVLTNVTNPRSQVNRHRIYEKTLIRRGATIGANATIVCGVTIGCYAFIGAGAVVTRDVPDYALVLGNPAKQKGWMSRHGHVLCDPDEEGMMTCLESGLRYQLVRSQEKTPAGEMLGAGIPNKSILNESLSALGHFKLVGVDLNESDSLPSELAIGSEPYRRYKRTSVE